MSITSTISSLSKSNEVVVLSFSGVENFQACEQYWATKNNGWFSFGKKDSQYTTLKKALEDHRAELRQNGAVFSDVVMFIEENTYYRFSRTNGVVENFSKQLEQHHQDCFNKNLYKQRKPHYLILPKAGLPASTVEFYFGNYVFVPDQSDTLLYTVKIQDGKTEYPVRWDAERQTPRNIPLGIYANQDGFCLGSGLTPELETKNLWPQTKCLHIDTNRIDEQNVIFGTRTTSTLQTNETTRLQFGVNDMTNCPIQSIGINDNPITIDFPSQSNDLHGELPILKNSQPREATNGESITLIFTPANMREQEIIPSNPTEKNNQKTTDPNKEKDEPVANFEENGANKENDGTIINIEEKEANDKTIIDFDDKESKTEETSYGKISIEAILLPRLDVRNLGESKEKKIVSWRLWFDKQGHLLKGLPSSGNPPLTLATDNSHSEVFISEDGKTYSTCNEEYFWGDLYINLHKIPETLRETFLAYLYLDNFSKVDLIEENSITIGRGVLNGPNDDVQLLLNYMHVQKSIKLNDGTYLPNFDRLYTSGKHASATLKGDTLCITQLSRSTPIFILGEAGQVVEQLNVVTSTSQGRTTVIEDGGKFIVGGYLLRFEAPRMTTKNNNEGTIV